MALFHYNVAFATIALSAASLSCGLLTLVLRAPLAGGGRKAARTLVAIVVCGAVVVGAGGGYRYLYGAQGDLAVIASLDRGAVPFGENSTLNASITVTNAGDTTVRVLPKELGLRMYDPNGTYLNSSSPEGARLPYGDDMTIELPPAGHHTWVLPIYLASPGSRDYYYGWKETVPGNYSVSGWLFSGPEATSLPVWSGVVYSGNVSLHVGGAG